MCGTIERLPASAVLSAGLEKRGNIVVASGGFTDIWRGEYHGAQVAIKAFRIYPAQSLKEAKEVSIQLAPKVYSQTKFTDSMEAGAYVEKAIPRKRPIIPRRERDTLSTRPRLRLGEKRQRQSVHSITPPHIPSVSGRKTLVIIATTELPTQFYLCAAAIRCCQGAGVPSFARYPPRGFERGKSPVPRVVFQPPHLRR